MPLGFPLPMRLEFGAGTQQRLLFPWLADSSRQETVASPAQADYPPTYAIPAGADFTLLLHGKVSLSRIGRPKTVGRPDVSPRNSTR